VKYLERGGNYTKSDSSKKRVDYKEKLDEATFKKFSVLRVLRKQIAAKDAVPAYMVFTDEELAALAKLSVITKQEMLKIKGIGDKKVEKYGEQMISALTK
jgi:superfamily II DNA helicase RecQ